MNLTVNPILSAEERHNAIFNGDFIIQTDIKAVDKLLQHTRQLILTAFDGAPPETAQSLMPVEDFIAIVSKLKSTFTNHDITKDIIREIIKELSYNPNLTYFDVPRLRVVTSDNYLSSGVGYAYKAHRDTWYGSPEQQVNVWLPVYDATPENGLLFYPYYWDQPMKNTSEQFDYNDWLLEGRKQAVNQVKVDSRNHPLPLTDPSTTLPFTYSGKAGSTLFFSASHLHGTMPNTSGKTRYSIDFRLIRSEDLSDGKGAINLDNRSKGTTLGDFLKASDLTKPDDSLINQFRK